MLVLDESQLSSPPPCASEEVRLLLGQNLARQPLFALVLICDNYLHDTLHLQQHKALYSCIGAHYQLPALERSQIEAYLTHGLRQVGLERPCFQPAALELLARAACVAAAQASLNTVPPEEVQAALELVPTARDRLNL